MYKRIKTFFQGKRILEINKRFIPQIRVHKRVIRWSWVAIQCRPSLATGSGSSDVEYYLHKVRQEELCSVRDAEKAALIIYGFLEFKHAQKLANKKIIHEVDPELWVRLKDKA